MKKISDFLLTESWHLVADSRQTLYCNLPNIQLHNKSEQNRSIYTILNEQIVTF